MTPLEVYNLLTLVQRDYVVMVRELNRLKKHLVNPVDPWELPLVKAMQKGRRDMGMVAGVPDAEKLKG